MTEVTPDTRDWAEVLDTGCRECGFTGSEDPLTAPAALTAAAAAWETVLERADATARPRPDRWSDVEYAAHMRDICALFAQRSPHALHSVLAPSGPLLHSGVSRI